MGDGKNFNEATTSHSAVGRGDMANWRLSTLHTEICDMAIEVRLAAQRRKIYGYSLMLSVCLISNRNMHFDMNSSIPARA